MKKTCIASLIILTVLLAGCRNSTRNQTNKPGNTQKSELYFENVQAIDHWNFRYHKRYDDFNLEDQIAQVKANMDVAAEFGFNSYLLFQKDAFQELLTWDGKYAPDEELKSAIREVIKYGRSKGLGLYLHSNQFAWPDEVGVSFSDSDEAWMVFENAMIELIETFPELAGYEVTGDETKGQLDNREGLLKFHNLTARALKSDGHERIALMRTWQRCEFLGVPEEELGKGDESNLKYSIKNTSGDFNIPNSMDSNYIKQGVDGSRLLIEFDAWREYETHGIFPLYLGDYWAPRFKAIADAGISSVGVRFNWNSGKFHIADKNRPYANWVNLYTFHRFTENPYADPDEILLDFCKMHFPESPDAAFDMYKHTFDFIKSVYYNEDVEKYLHHGGLERPRGTPVGLEQVTLACEKMKPLIDKIPDENQYKSDLLKYFTVTSYLGRIAAGDLSVQDDWKALDPESYKELSASKADKWK